MTVISNYIKIRIYKTTDEYRQDDVVFVKNGKERGYGFIDKEDGKQVALGRCPKCGLENYYANVLAGICTWCGFEANKVEFEDEKENKSGEVDKES